MLIPSGPMAVDDLANQISYFPLHQSQTVSGCWCRDWRRVHFDIAGTLKQKSEQQSWHRPLHHQKIDLTSTESSEVLAINSVGR